MNTNPYFTHCISNTIDIPNAPTKSKQTRNMLYNYFTSNGIKLAICKVLNFNLVENKDKL
jgi:hypothetical protein